MEASSSLREACMSDERGPPRPLLLPLPLPLHLGLPIMKRRRHHYQLSSKGADSLMFSLGAVKQGSAMDFLVSRVKDLQWRIIQGSAIVLYFQNWSWQRCKNKDDAGSNSTYLRWKEYQHEIAIDLAVPFHRGSLAGAMMSKGGCTYTWSLLGTLS